MKFLGYIALVLWFVLGYKYYTDHSAGCSSAAASAISSGISCPICFDWGSPNPQVCDQWKIFRDSLVNELDDGQHLLIQTRFNPEESEDSELGRNRAVSIKALFNGFLDEDRIKIQVVKNQVSKHNDCQIKSSLVVGTESNELREQNDTATIYLEGSPISANPKVRGYLDKVARRVKESGEKVRIIGHTDSDGSEVSNIKLGFKRADNIKSYLISLGVARENVITISKGENEPLHGNTNSTDEEKAKNRRIQINISKS